MELGLILRKVQVTEYLYFIPFSYQSTDSAYKITCSRCHGVRGEIFIFVLILINSSQIEVVDLYVIYYSGKFVR